MIGSLMLRSIGHSRVLKSYLSSKELIFVFSNYPDLILNTEILKGWYLKRHSLQTYTLTHRSVPLDKLGGEKEEEEREEGEEENKE